jgi:hypothetical protein
MRKGDTVSKARTKEIALNIVDLARSRVSEFLAKKTRYEGELEKELQALYDAYGAGNVKALLKTLALDTVPLRNEREDSVEQPKRRRGRPRTVRKDEPEEDTSSGISVKDLRPIVEKALEQLKGKQFARPDVDIIIKENNPGLEFDISYVSNILRNHEKLIKVGTKTSPNSPRDLNVYAHADDTTASDVGSDSNHKQPAEATA